MTNLRPLILRYLSLVLILTSVLGCGSTSKRSEAIVPSSPVQKFVPPTPERWSLPNGIQVMFLEDKELPIVSGSLYIRSGGLWEPKSSPGLAGALGDLMRKGGAGDLNADALDERLEELSAGISSAIGAEFGVVSFGCLAPDFDEVLRLTADVIMRPRFEQHRVDLWKSQSVESIKRRIDDPWTVAGISFNQVLYGPTRYGQVTVVEDVRRVTAAKLKALHQKFMHPDGALLVITGAVDRSAVERLVLRELGGWPARNKVRSDYPPVDHEPKAGIYFIELPASQASIYIGHLGVSRLTPDYPAIDGFNQVFGAGSFGSRLVKKIRAELGLTYGISGGIVPGPVRGRNLIAFQTKGASAGDGIEQSLRELLRLQEELVSLEELAEMQRAVSNSFIFRFETPEKAIVRRANQELLGFPDDYDQTYLPKIASLTPDDIREVARKRWNQRELVVVVAGDKTAYSAVERMLKSPGAVLYGLPLRKMKFDQRLKI